MFETKKTTSIITHEWFIGLIAGTATSLMLWDVLLFVQKTLAYSVLGLSVVMIFGGLIAGWGAHGRREGRMACGLASGVIYYIIMSLVYPTNLFTLAILCGVGVLGGLASAFLPLKFLS